jgi:hypothetical protein
LPPAASLKCKIEGTDKGSSNKDQFPHSTARFAPIHCKTRSAPLDRFTFRKVMQTSAEAVYSASSPPFILDSDMLGRRDSDPDFEFFDSTNLPVDAANSPGFFLAEDFATEGSQYLPNFGSPNLSNLKSPLSQQASLLDTRVQQSLSAPSTASPAGSYQDSSSESSGYKRKSSSDSSRSALTPGDVMMNDDADMGDWKAEDMIAGNDASVFGGYGGTIDPSAMNNNYGGFSDKSMENDFDFESAASSPSPFAIGPVDMESPEMPAIKYDTPRRNSPMLKTKLKNHNKANSVSCIFTLDGNGILTCVIATFSNTVNEWPNDRGF